MRNFPRRDIMTTKAELEAKAQNPALGKPLSALVHNTIESYIRLLGSGHADKV